LKLLLDQDVYASTALLLRALAHDVLTASELGLSQASDVELLQAAANESRILVTRDRHFGSLVFQMGRRTGVIYLRVTPSQLADVHDELARILTSRTEGELREAFVVVEPGEAFEIEGLAVGLIRNTMLM